MNLFKTIIRIVSGILILALGAFHFYAYDYMAVFVPLPMGSKAFVLIVAALISLCAIALILNKYSRTALITIGITLAFTSFLVMIPMAYREPDEMLKQINLSNLYKLVLAFVVFAVLIFSKPEIKN
ncbi:MAG: hypothetical protein Q8M15_13500 [Bacteroidota bacterium]|nr:hypothetical protein [Bacteroidota bacterium]